MNIDVVSARLATNKFRIAEVLVRYYDLSLYLDVCLYKEEKLWVRMPEMWLTPHAKRKFAFWESKEISDRCQEIVLNKVFDMLGLDLESAIKEKNAFFAKRKELTPKEKNITLSKHSSEV